MDSTATFAKMLRHFREKLGISQEELAARSHLDRTYVSQLERGLKSPALTTIDKLASCLQLLPSDLLQEIAAEEELSLRVHHDYHIRDYHIRNSSFIHVQRPRGTTVELPANLLIDAIDEAHKLIDQLYSAELDIALLLSMRNLSAFIGELMAAAVLKTTGDQFRKNPHQDGYPDLLLMDDVGHRAWAKLEGRLTDKSPFSPFAGGGIEVKATCGSVPSPDTCRNRKIERPALGSTRIGCMKSYDWKAHHRDTNNLAGVLWDFIGGRPRIAALFYRADLTIEDWGKIISPKEGGGRTTSVSIMTPSGIRKMYEGWLCVINRGGYAEFLNRRNGADLIPIN